jgi:hypothetical protein
MGCLGGVGAYPISRGTRIGSPTGDLCCGSSQANPILHPFRRRRRAAYCSPREALSRHSVSAGATLTPGARLPRHPPPHDSPPELKKRCPPKQRSYQYAVRMIIAATVSRRLPVARVHTSGMPPRSRTFEPCATLCIMTIPTAVLSQPNHTQTLSHFASHF